MKDQLHQLRRQSKAHGIPQEVQQQIEFAKHAKEAVD
jgi:NADH pyrophosphatase NudC (nudix superfamily)